MTTAKIQSMKISSDNLPFERLVEKVVPEDADQVSETSDEETHGDADSLTGSLQADHDDGGKRPRVFCRHWRLCLSKCFCISIH